MMIPNLRNKEEREKYRNDTTCTDPKVAGDMLIPVFSKGNPEISEEIYDSVKEKWHKELTEGDSKVRNMFGSTKE